MPRREYLTRFPGLGERGSRWLVGRRSTFIGLPRAFVAATVAPPARSRSWRSEAAGRAGHQLQSIV